MSPMRGEASQAARRPRGGGRGTRLRVGLCHAGGGDVSPMDDEEESMEILEKKIGGVNVVALGGRLDAYVSGDVEQKLNALVDADEISLVVSLEGLEYISSSGLRVLLASLKKVKKKEGDIKLACMKPHIREVFDVAGFSQLFSIYDHEDVAVQAFNRK